jgi:hypothetical protein
MNRGLGKGKAGNLTELSHGQLAAVQSEKHPSARGGIRGHQRSPRPCQLPWLTCLTEGRAAGFLPLTGQSGQAGPRQRRSAAGST